MNSSRRNALFVLPALAVVVISGCSTYKPAPASYNPQIGRALIQTNGPIIAEVAVMSVKEAEKKFGLPLHKKDIQPVWLRLSNTSTNRYYFLPAGLDPVYHPASEVAYMYRNILKPKRNRKITEFLDSNQIELLITPTNSVEGFVFASMDPGAKHVEVDVLGELEHIQFEFTVLIPGKRIDYQKVDFEALYPTNEFRDLTLDEFHKALHELPIETTDKSGRGRGDPLNLVVVSDENNKLALAFLRNNWDVTEVLTFWNGIKLVGSFLFKSRWRTSPVSPLYVFDRPQDFALQKARSTIHERNHLRLWLAPYTCEGRYVWVGQISRDIGLRFTFRAPGFVTHKIDPDTDEARNYLAQEMILSGSVSRLAWVGGIGKHTWEEPGRNLTGDPWVTDGNRVVLFLSRDQIPTDKIHVMDWRESEEPPRLQPKTEHRSGDSSDP